MLTLPTTGYPTPPVLSSMTLDISATVGAMTSASSAAWPSANMALYFPVRVDQRRTYQRAWWINGATAAGNVAVGIYTVSGTTATQIVTSTAQAQSGTSVMQVATTFAATTLNPGLYYLAMSCSLTTTTVLRASPGAQVKQSLGVLQSASSHPLPSSVTVTAPTQSVVPVFGFSELTTI